MINILLSGAFQWVTIWVIGVSHVKLSVGLESLELRQWLNGF